MLNRRSFVHSLGVGAVGGLTLGRVEAFDRLPEQARAGRPAPMPGAIRIGSNENPYGPTAAAMTAAHEAIAQGHRYGGGASGQVVEVLGTQHGVPTARIMMSGGSGDVLRSAVSAFTGPSLSIVSGGPSYEQPVRQAKTAGIPVVEVPLTTDLKLDLGPMLDKGKGAGLVYICNPNNPTSTIVPASQVTELVQRLAEISPSTIVLVDEAYFEFADDPAFGTLIPLVDKYPTLVIARTFSKIHGMAGMRLGYAIAQEATLAKMRALHSSSGVSAMTYAAGLASLKDTAALEKNQSLNREVRAFTVTGFEQAGYTVADSQANFLMVDIRRDARGFIEACRTKGVMIGRPFPPLDTWARITVGTGPEMDKAMGVFLEVLATPPAAAVAAIHPSMLDYWTC